MTLVSDGIPTHVPLRTALVLAVSIASSAFGAGVAVMRAQDAAQVAIGDAIAPVKMQADAARADAMKCEGELSALRADLAYGVGRALAGSDKASARDWAGKTARQFYERDRRESGEAAALRHVFDSDF